MESLQYGVQLPPGHELPPGPMTKSMFTYLPKEYMCVLLALLLNRRPGCYQYMPHAGSYPATIVATKAIHGVIILDIVKSANALRPHPSISIQLANSLDPYFIICTLPY